MKKSIAIIGGGTAGLFLAAFLDPSLFKVRIFEKKSTLGRKFLVAGDGGFNLSHSEQMADFHLRYTPSTFLKEALFYFSNEDLRKWLHALGIPTFIGSSKRIFPEKGIKPIQVLKAIKSFLEDKNVQFQFNKTFTGWNDENHLIFNDTEIIEADYTVFALGGSSWKITGSDGNWREVFSKKGIQTKPFLAANCAFQLDWTADFISKQEGKPLKNISISIQNQVQKGEAVITAFGIEGNAIYALSPKIQAELARKKEAIIYIDFKPTLSPERLLQKLQQSKFKRTQILKQVFKLSPSAIHLIKTQLSKDVFLDDKLLVENIKKLPLKITAAAPIEEAISTSGGIQVDAVSPHFELVNLKNNFCIGEMLDWNAPTGGYLIQGCASMGAFLANHVNKSQNQI